MVWIQPVENAGESVVDVRLVCEVVIIVEFHASRIVLENSHMASTFGHLEKKQKQILIIFFSKAVFRLGFLEALEK